MDLYLRRAEWVKLLDELREVPSNLPISMLLWVIFKDIVDADNIVRASIRELGRSLDVSHMSACRARDALLEVDALRYKEKRLMLNPKLYFRGGRGRHFGVEAIYSALPRRELTVGELLERESRQPAQNDPPSGG